MNRKRGFTLIELLVVMAIIALLIGLLLPALAKAESGSELLKDGTQIEQIHQAWVIFAREFDGNLPTPGLINRRPVDVGNGRENIPGRGLEDVAKNTSANLHSALIMNNYYGPEICVGPTEPNGSVFVMDNYNYELYNVVADIYWDGDDSLDAQNVDSGFRADLDGSDTGRCNISYASMPICGERKTREWKETYNSKFALLGNRGTPDGAILPAHITYEIHGGRKQWVGNLCYNDNHVEVSSTFYPEGLEFQAGSDTIPDNVFDNQTGSDECSGTDVWLTLVDKMEGSAASGLTFIPEWD